MRMTPKTQARVQTRRRTNIPTCRPALIGRRAETAEIINLLTGMEDGAGARLLTLIGPGGCGKTSLVLQVADQLCPYYRDGAWFIALDSAPASASLDLVADAVVTSLNIPVPQETANGSLLDEVLAYVRERQLLLILDTCERAIEGCAAFAEAILSACPQARLLATSRESLACQYEVIWPTPPLALPPTTTRLRQNVPYSTHIKPEQAMEYGALELFQLRAQAAQPAFRFTDDTVDLIVQVCQRLDGLPLAIEIAASCLRAFSLEAILSAIDAEADAPTDALMDSCGLSGTYPPLERIAYRRTAAPRQRTLEATLLWSYRLLSEDEQMVLRRLSIFAAPFSADAARAICGLPADQTLQCLLRLVDTCLVQVVLEHGEHSAPQSERRYRLLETVRRFGRQQLHAETVQPGAQGTQMAPETTEEEATAERYSAWVVGIVETAQRALASKEQIMWLNRLTEERDHLRAVLHWLLTHGWQERAARLATALAGFWRQRGPLTEGRRWLEMGLDVDLGRAPAPGAFLSLGQPNFPLSRQSLTPLTRARALNALGTLVMWQGEYSNAQALHLEALAHFQAFQGQVAQAGVALTLFRLGFLADRQGDETTAMRLLKQSQHTFALLGNTQGVEMARNRLGIVAWNQGDYLRAEALLVESVRIYRQRGHLGALAATLHNLGALALEQGAIPRAIGLLHESLTLNTALRDSLAIAYTLTTLATAAYLTQEPQQAAQLFSDALALLDGASAPPDLFFRLIDGLAMIVASQGDLLGAARLWGAMERLRATSGLSYRSGERENYAQAVTAARQTMEHAGAPIKEAFAHAWSEGSALSQYAVFTLAISLTAQICDARMSSAHLFSHQSFLSRCAGDSPGGNSGGNSGDSCGATKRDSPVGALMNASREIDSPRVPQGSTQQPALRLYGWGEVILYRDDRLVTSAEFTYTKAKELLLYLWTFPGHSWEQVCLALWPDTPGKQAHTSFRVVLHHLRRALGDTRWIAVAGRRYTLNFLRPCWYDVAAFEATLVEAYRRQDDAPALAVALFEQALSLARGDFGEGLASGEWLMQRRRDLRRKQLDALVALGRLLLARGAPTRALTHFLQAVACDSFCEEAHRGVIQSYFQAQDYSQAAYYYEQMRQYFATELGVPPSPETRALIWSAL